MAGLSATRALSNHFDRVTVIERDELPGDPMTRKGVPQGNHVHALLAGGYNVLKGYYPTMPEQMTEAGVAQGDITGDFLWYQYDHWKLRADCGLTAAFLSRPLLEYLVRKNTKALPNVTFLEGYDGEQPVYDRANRRVTGLDVKNRATGETQTLEADLVLDASGRGSQTPKWLESWGFARPEETEIKVDVGYATAIIERRPGDLWDAHGMIIATAPPKNLPRGAGVISMERDRWVVTLAGGLGDHPPTDYEGWMQFAKTIPGNAVAPLLEGRELLREIMAYKYPANRRRHYHELTDFPAGYLVLGDGVCSFNPVYGQGMTVSLNEAKALDECLATGDSGLWKRYFARTRAITDIPWLIAAGEDLRYPQVEGKRPRGFALRAKYLERAHKAATKDPVVLKKFFEVANLVAPPSNMFQPAVVARVVAGGRGKQQRLPAKKRRLATT
ncbi:MAG: NAD(P)/FAD-dependent oxidoreductase [Dehalococcoidia bacterium]